MFYIIVVVGMAWLHLFSEFYLSWFNEIKPIREADFVDLFIYLFIFVVDLFFNLTLFPKGLIIISTLPVPGK